MKLETWINQKGNLANKYNRKQRHPPPRPVGREEQDERDGVSRVRTSGQSWQDSFPYKGPRLHVRAAKFGEENLLIGAFDGTDDHIATPALLELWKSWGMDKERAKAIADVDEDYERKIGLGRLRRKSFSGTSRFFF